MRLKLLTYFLVFSTMGMAQSVGLSINQTNSLHRKVQGALGMGIYSTIQLENERFSLLLNFNVGSNSSQFDSEDFKTDFEKLSFNATLLNSWSISENFYVKLGPGASFNRMNVEDRGIFQRWVRSAELNSLGLNVTGNMHFKNAFSLPINIDFFVIPTYILNRESSNLIDLEFNENLKILDLRLGISYGL